MNKHYVYDEETTMTQQRIESDFDDASNFGRALATGIALTFLLVVLAWCATANAQTARTATITFTAPTTRTDGSAITGALSYEVWQGLKGGTKTKVSTITTSATTINTGLVGGREYCWHVVAVEAGGGSSVPSNEACKAFAVSEPNTVTITVT